MSRSRESSLGSVAMEEEEDDLYGSGPTDAPARHNNNVEESEEDDDDDDEDDDSDIEIVTERADLGPEPTTASRTNQKPLDTSHQQPNTSASGAAQPAHQQTRGAAPTTIRITADPLAPVAQGKPILLPGAHYPAVRTSKAELDLDNIPLWEGKPITELDIDADLAEAMKPWRRPGADQSDYFNYGFDEFSWAMYCEKVKSMKHGIDEQKSENAKFEAMMGPMPGMPGGGGGGGGQQGNNSPMPGMGGAGGGMPGMPSEQDMMNLTMQYMQANNIQDISQVDFGAVMQFMGGGGGGGGGGMGMGGGGQQGGQGGWGGQQQQQGGYGGGGGGGRRGRGRW